MGLNGRDWGLKGLHWVKIGSKWVKLVIIGSKRGYMGDNGIEMG